MANKDVVVKEGDIKDISLFVVEEGQEEHLSQEELDIPFLRIAQKGTPQVDEDNPGHVEGLKPGQFFNTVSSQVYGDTLKVQVHAYFRNFVIWKGEKGHGEFSGTMTPEEFAAFEKDNKLIRDGGDMTHTVDGEQYRYTDTRNFIVSLPDYLEEGVMVFPMSSTGIKPSKNWNVQHNSRRINGKPTERYATIWELTTKGFEKNGFTWKQVSSIKPLGWASPELLKFGQDFKEFAKSIKDTGIKYSTDDEAETEALEDSEL